MIYVSKLYLNKTDFLKKENLKKKNASLPFIILWKLFNLSEPHLLIYLADNTYIEEFFKIIYATLIPMGKYYFWVLVCVWLGSSVNIPHSESAKVLTTGIPFCSLCHHYYEI